MDKFVNRDGYTVEVAPIEKVEMYEDGGCAISRGVPGWGTFGLSKAELGDFVPQVGDIVIVYTQQMSRIRGVVIDGRVLRYVNAEQAKAEHEQWVKNYRLEKLEKYLEHGDALKERAKALPAPLRARMERFAEEGGIDFWIDDASYEMYALEGAASLLRKVQSLEFIADVDYPTEGSDVEGAIKWIDDWWAINSADHDPPYDYKKQMEMVPDFGDGHSGNTAGAAMSLAKWVLRGEEV